MSDKKKIIFKKLEKMNTIWHPESTLVFKSQKERLVIGKYVNSTFTSLDADCIEMCEKWGFTPDESLMEDEEQEVTQKSNNDSEEEEVVIVPASIPIVEKQVPTVVEKQNIEKSVPIDDTGYILEDPHKLNVEFSQFFNKMISEYSDRLEASVLNKSEQIFIQLKKANEIIKLQAKIIDKMNNDYLALKDEKNKLQVEYNAMKEKFDKFRSLCA